MDIRPTELLKQKDAVKEDEDGSDGNSHREALTATEQEETGTASNTATTKIKRLTGKQENLTATNERAEKKVDTIDGDEHDDDDDDNDDQIDASGQTAPVDETQPAVAGTASTGAKKKRKRKKKTPIKDALADTYPKRHRIEALDNKTVFRCLNDWPALEDSVQSFPPSVPIHEAYLDHQYPVGETSEYVGENAFRMTDEEKRYLERMHETDYQSIRRAAECHRQVRKYAQSYIRPGMSMIEICQRLEKKSLELIAANGLESGWGFPTGCSLNHVAAHYTPNYGDDTILQKGDIMKLDFGLHVSGRIVDCAFSVAFEPMFDELIRSTQEGTNAGIRAAGIDARFSEIGAAIHEAIESHEMEVDGKAIPIKPISNLNGHSIAPYRIHAGKSLPIIRNDYGERMEESEVYAIETFATTGKGRVIESGECSHYMKDFDVSHIPLRMKSSKLLLHEIDKHFSTLAFCRRWLDDLGQQRHLMALKSLVDGGIVKPYPPLSDIRGSYVSQMEHTILLRPTCKEVVSRGPDY